MIGRVLYRRNLDIPQLHPLIATAQNLAPNVEDDNVRTRGVLPSGLGSGRKLRPSLYAVQTPAKHKLRFVLDSFNLIMETLLGPHVKTLSSIALNYCDVGQQGSVKET